MRMCAEEPPSLPSLRRHHSVSVASEGCVSAFSSSGSSLCDAVSGRVGLLGGALVCGRKMFGRECGDAESMRATVRATFSRRRCRLERLMRCVCKVSSSFFVKRWGQCIRAGIDGAVDAMPQKESFTLEACASSSPTLVPSTSAIHTRTEHLRRLGYHASRGAPVFSQQLGDRLTRRAQELDDGRLRRTTSDKIKKPSMHVMRHINASILQPSELGMKMVFDSSGRGLRLVPTAQAPKNPFSPNWHGHGVLA